MMNTVSSKTQDKLIKDGKNSHKNTRQGENHNVLTPQAQTGITIVKQQQGARPQLNEHTTFKCEVFSQDSLSNAFANGSSAQSTTASQITLSQASQSGKGGQNNAQSCNTYSGQKKLGHESTSNGAKQLQQQSSMRDYKQTTQVLLAHKIVQSDSTASQLQNSESSQNFPRVMQREKRQTKYESKRQQPTAVTVMSQRKPLNVDQSQWSSEYQPLRRQQNHYQQKSNQQSQQYMHNDMMGFSPGYQEVGAGTDRPKQRRKHVHNHAAGGVARSGYKNNNHNFVEKDQARADHDHANSKFSQMAASTWHSQQADDAHEFSETQVKIYSDAQGSRFANHPVNAYQAPNSKVQNLAKTAKSKKDSAKISKEVQQLQGHLNDQNFGYDNRKVENQNRQKDCLNQASQVNEKKTGLQKQQYNKMDQNSAEKQQVPHTQHEVGLATQQQQVQCLRFNSAAVFNQQMQTNSVPGGLVAQDYANRVQTNSQRVVHQTEQMTGGFQSSTFRPYPQPQTHAYPQSFTPMRMNQGVQGHYAPNYTPLNPWQQQSYQSSANMQNSNNLRNMGIDQTQLQRTDHNSFQPPMQIVSTPLRMKTQNSQSYQQLSPHQVQQQSPLKTNGKLPSDPVKQKEQKSKVLLDANTPNLNCSERESQVLTKTVEESKQTGNQTEDNCQPSSDALVQKSTQSAEQSELISHPETFECLTKCTNWYLVAQVGNSQLKIPAKSVAVRFQDNPQELPILTNDMDLFENLVQKEQQLSCSKTPIVQLNRAVNAGNNPSSSNNVSNNGYRKKENVQNAQQQYESQLKLNLVGDQQEEQTPQNKYPLHLPIDNSSHDTQTRITDLFLHHRTQQLMCLEFDLTHLKIDESGESSISGDCYYDSLSINPGSAEGDPSQPTPFLGVAKNQGAYAHGQPSHVLYINTDNSVASQLRVINQEYVERNCYFKLNGECHGNLVFEHDLRYQIQGKKVIKSIQERLIRAKDHIFNEIMQSEPTCQDSHSSERYSSHSESRGRESYVPRTTQKQKQHQRSQKSVLATLRTRNKKNKGPYLRRSDQLHTPLCNVTKSVGFKMLMSNLASIDNMLTNFNQIVMQEGVIQSLFFSFDLPVHQLSTAKPAISNNLVVKIPKEIPAGQPQNAHHQAAYLAYQQHQAAMTHYYGPQPLQQVNSGLPQQPGLVHQSQPHEHFVHQAYFPSAQQPIIQRDEQNEKPMNGESQSSGVDQQQKHLWNLVDEFKRIATTPSASNSDARQQASPFQANLPLAKEQMGSIPFSQNFVGSSVNSNCSSNQHNAQYMSHRDGTSQGQGQLHQSNPFTRFSMGTSSQNSNLSFHQANFGMYPAQPINGLVQEASPQMLGATPNGVINPLLMPQIQQPQGNQLPGVPQQLHQALYSLKTAFNAGSFGFTSSAGTSDIGSVLNHGGLQGPVYSPPEDPNYYSNLDRLLVAITPIVSQKQLESMSVRDYFKAFKRTSVLGLRVELLNEQTQGSEIVTFIPTLSSLVLSYNKPQFDPQGDRINRILSFENVTDAKDKKCQQTQKETNLEVKESQAKTKDLVEKRADTSIASVSQSLGKHQMRFVEEHESEPHYARPPFFQKIKEIVASIPDLKQVLLRQESFNFEQSWFSVLWTCQRVCSVPQSESLGSESENYQEIGDEVSKIGSQTASSIQFLAIFRFCPEQVQSREVGAKNCALASRRRQPVQLIGLMPYKCERESFWVSPSHLQTDNNLQGEMYDQICEDNIILMQDLKQRAIEFLQPQQSRAEMHDFTYLLNSTNSTIYDMF